MLATAMDETALLCHVEIPKGSRNKYEWDHKQQAIKLNRFLFSSVVYPTDYGFVPGTLSDGGDELDAMICVSEPTFPGCRIHVRVVGVLCMRDESGQSDKLLCVPGQDPNWDHVERLDDLSERLRNEIEHFFSIYKQPEGKDVEIQGWKDYDQALAAIEEGRRRYAEARS
jgi:inorganic pyrophosphatase